MQERQLAAIMFADIVGYTSLMGQDESNALELVRKSREIQKSLIEKHHGKWLKEMGDGSLAQFKSALDAVYCAIDIQEAAGKELKAQLRIGIHLGDITIEDEEIYGDGVNVASRIESVADPGSVFISDAVYGAIKGVSDVHAQFRGERKLKNVKGPVRIYKILTGEVPDTLPERSFKKYLIPAIIIVLAVIIGIWRLTGFDFRKSSKTILVLPFELSETDSSNQYLVQSITEELIRNLGKVSALTVINPITSLQFQASVTPLTDAIDRLDKTDYFIKGSLDVEGSRITIELDLFDHKENKLWSNSYSDDLARLPELTGRIAVDISEELKVKLGSGEHARITGLRPIDPEIYELWVKALNEVYKWNAESYTKARIYLNEAIDKSPADARTWAMLAEALVTMGHSDSPPTGVWQEAQAAALRALQLDSLNAEAWAALAHSKTYFEWDYEGAEYGYHKANELNPSNAMNHYHYAWHLYLHDRLDEAIEEHLIAQELDPLQPGHTYYLASLYISKGELDKARSEMERVYRITSDSLVYLSMMGRLYLETEQYDSAIYAFKKVQNNIGLGKAYFRKGDIESGMKLMQKVNSYPINPWRAWVRAQLYAEIDSLDRFFEYANYEQPHAFFPWFRKAISNPKVIQDPRFKQLMDKMNLPMPERDDWLYF